MPKKPRHEPTPTAAVPPQPKRTPARGLRFLLWAVYLLILAAGLVFADWWFCLPDDAQATYVGRESCIACHREASDAWQGSHHDLAMDVATPETVLGDFNDVEFEQFGIRSRLFRRDGKYWAHTEGPDGKLADFEVKWVFGVDPLQQYMVEFDRPKDMPAHEIARVQVLRICWDTQRKEWFYLPPPDAREQLAPDDDLHWTGVAQRWNNMCADCHSTNLQKNYDVATQTYHTTFSEIDVSCEACHGPASLHVQLANRKSLFWDRKRGYALPVLNDSSERLIQSCAPCHSRRAHVHPGYLPGDSYHDFFNSELLQRTTYHADGQILDEVYEYASFIQSKMYHKDIRCTDCHDPHSAKRRHTDNTLCTSCHQHPAGRYDTPAHHFHQPDSTGAACVECHMPQTTYMEVHARRDHSIRNPRPDLSVQLGMPNACTRCHLDKSKAGLEDRDDLRQYLDWILAARNGDEKVKTALAQLDQEMDRAFQEWYGKQRQQERRFDKYFTATIAAAHRSEPQAEKGLIRAAGDARLPAIVRATALLELGQYDSLASTNATVDLLGDPYPPVRATAIANLQGRLAEGEFAQTIAPLLTDPTRLVRTEAARALSGVPDGVLRGFQRQQLSDALAEYKAGLLVNNDRAGAHLMLGIVAEGQGQEGAAVRAYQDAMHVEPRTTGPRTNLAALYDRLAETEDRRASQAASLGNPSAAEKAAREATRLRSEAARLRREELDLFARDARLAPDAAFVQYRYGMLLYLHRRYDEAEQALRTAAELLPNNPQFLLGLVLFYKERHQPAQALPLAEQLCRLRPHDATYQQVLAEIREQSSASARPSP
ncbi:MAG: ammonia-forming cytochrome c nitrite reductase subunit c552 [Candidatus Anammoximicrobium sp.]|nr:ammonia-forming cytochrome c nitrite reductase subunit c552 [Candidatus Anammoximicrobium sp.]